MRKNLLIAGMLIAITAIFSCQKNNVDPIANPNSSTAGNGSGGNAIITGRISTGGGCTPTEVTLVAGQTINSGTVSVTNDADYIYVTYTTAAGWYLTQTHLYVGDCALVPVNGQGNPIPGHFPYASAHNNATSYTYQVPISAIPAGGCGCIAAHAVVVQLNAAGQVIQTQTGWGNGTRINPNGGNWGMKFDYCSCTTP